MNSTSNLHETDPHIVKHLKRARGHLRSVIESRNTSAVRDPQEPDLSPSFSCPGDHARRDRTRHDSTRPARLRAGRGRRRRGAGAALAIKMIAYVAVAPIEWAFAQRVPQRAMLVALDLVRAAVAVLVQLVTEFWQVYVLIFVLQSVSAAFMPTFQATIPNILPKEKEYTRALSLSRRPTTWKASSARCWRHFSPLSSSTTCLPAR